MKFIRSILILIFSALLLIVVQSIIASKKFTLYALLGALFILSIILLLGPFWPQEGRQSKMSILLDKCFDNYPIISNFLAGSLVGASCLYMASNALAHPTRPLRLGLIYDIFGPEGIALIWFIAGVCCIAKFIKDASNKNT